jgi:hypothetical protein
MKESVGLALVTLFLCLPLKVALLFLLILFITYKYTFSIETLIRNASKGGKPNRKPYHPYGFINLYKTLQSINEENLSLLMKSIL